MSKPPGEGDNGGFEKFCMVLLVKLETVVAFVMGKQETGKQAFFFHFCLKLFNKVKLQ